MSAEHLFLPHLRHLKRGWFHFPELGSPRNLTMLRELRFCLKKERGYKISELCNLVELRNLNIRGLENVSGSEEAGAANMKGKHHLKELNLTWRPNSNDELRTSEAVFDGLEPHVGLKKMDVRGYPGSRAPCWFQTYSFKSKLEQICIDNCPNWKVMSFLQHLPSLMVLTIQNMRALERIDTHEVSRGCQLFPKLRILVVGHCPMLKTLPPLPLGLKTLELDDMSSLTTLPEWTVQDNETPWLSKMSIISCPNLISLKEGLLQGNVKLKHLKEVKIVNCLKLVHLPDLLPTSLTEIYLRDCSSITSLDLFGLTSLEDLEIACCGAFESVNLQGTPGYTSDPCWFLKSKLEVIFINNCPNWKDMSFLQHLPSLMELSISNMEALERIGTPDVSRGCQLFPKLRFLKVTECPMLKTLPPLPLGLKTLDLYSLSSLTTLPGWTVQDNETSWLFDLAIYKCPNLISLKEGLLRENVKLKHLKKVEIMNCLRLVHLPNLLPVSLSNIVLRECSSITSLDLSGLTVLNILEISFCCKLESVEGLENLASLTRVDIMKCPQLPHNRMLQQNEHLTYTYVP